MLYTILYMNLASSTFATLYFEGPHNRGEVLQAAKKRFKDLDDQVTTMIVAIMPGKPEIVLPGEFIIERNSFTPKKISNT
jgi:hypothetical protein